MNPTPTDRHSKGNRSNAKSKPVHGGYIGLYRPCWKSTYEPVQEIDANGAFVGQKIFETAEEAELAAWRTLRDITEPAMVCTGPLPSIRDIRKQAAEKQFNGVTA
jgi:hypothetical protein